MVSWDGSEVEGRFLISWDCYGVVGWKILSERLAKGPTKKTTREQ